MRIPNIVSFALLSGAAIEARHMRFRRQATQSQLGSSCTSTTALPAVTVTKGPDNVYTQVWECPQSELYTGGVRPVTYTITETCTQALCHIATDTAPPATFTTAVVACSACGQGGSALTVTVTCPTEVVTDYISSGFSVGPGPTAVVTTTSGQAQVIPTTGASAGSSNSAPGGASSSVPGGSAGGAPGSVPGGSASSAPGGASGSAPGGTSGSVPGGSAGGSPSSVPGGSASSAPGGASSSVPSGSASSAPGGASSSVPSGSTAVVPGDGLPSNTIPVGGGSTNTAPAGGASTNDVPAPGSGSDTVAPPAGTSSTTPAGGVPTDDTPAPGTGSDTTAPSTASTSTSPAGGLSSTSPSPPVVTGAGAAIKGNAAVGGLIGFMLFSLVLL